MPRGKLGRITLDDYNFQRLIEGETIELEVRPDTVKIEIRLDERSRHRKAASEILSELLKQS